jgi:uncharacterized protein (DUF1778 family)
MKRRRSTTGQTLRQRTELRVSEERKRRWAAAAAASGRTLSNWITWACDAAEAKLRARRRG